MAATRKPNRTILVTGASSGVGRSLARFFASSFDVIAAARRLDTMRAAFADTPSVRCYRVDLSEPEAVSDFCDQVRTDVGHVARIVNNAGVNDVAPVDELNPARLQHSIQVNAFAPLMIMQAFLPGMREENFGRIANVTSGAPLNCFPGFAAYSSSKALLNALTVTAAREHESYNIKINLMSPGPVRSEMTPDSSLAPEICHPTADYLVNLPSSGPTGRFFWLGHEVPLFPDLEGVDWLAGEAHDRLKKVL